MKIVLLLFCILASLPHSYATTGGGGSAQTPAPLLWQCPYCIFTTINIEVCRKHIHKTHVCDICHDIAPSLDKNGFATQIFWNDKEKGDHKLKYHIGTAAKYKNGAALLGARHPIYLGPLDETQYFHCAICKFGMSKTTIVVALPAHMKTSAYCKAFYDAHPEEYSRLRFGTKAADYGDGASAGAGGGGGSGWEEERAAKNSKKNTLHLCRLCTRAMTEESMLGSPDDTPPFVTEIIILPDERCNECACQDDCESRKKVTDS